MPTPRYGFAIAAYQGKIYCIGGASNFQPPNGDNGLILSPVNEVYNPEANIWETKAQVPLPRVGAEANVVNGKIYLVGGTPQGNINQVYDPATDSWSTESSMPESPKYMYISTVFDDRIYEMGRNVEIYNPQNNLWNALTPQPQASLGGIAAAATLGIFAPQRIYIFGSTTKIYHPEDNTWVAGASMLSNRDRFGVGVVNDIVYVIGGQRVDYQYPSETGPSTVTPSAINEQYIPLGYGTVPPKVSLLLAMNQTYNESIVPFVFSVDRTASWMGYSLDGHPTVTIYGNSTIDNVANGQHSITIYANDTFGNMATSQTINFTVAVSSKECIEPFAAVIIVAVLATAAAIVVAVALVFYFRKHRPG